MAPVPLILSDDRSFWLARLFSYLGSLVIYVLNQSVLLYCYLMVRYDIHKELEAAFDFKF